MNIVDVKDDVYEIELNSFNDISAIYGFLYKELTDGYSFNIFDSYSTFSMKLEKIVKSRELYAYVKIFDYSDKYEYERDDD